MKDLVAKLSQAQEGSRELDTEVEISRKGGPANAPPWARDWRGEKRKHSTGRVWLGDKAHFAVPYYTTNLQDARGLVPEGLRLRLEDRGYAWYVDLDRYEHNETHDLHGADRQGAWAEAATPALALTIAALKARAAS